MSEPDLTAARVAVLAALGSAPGSLRPPSVNSPAPLTMLPPGVEARIAARVAAGLAPVDGDHPRLGAYQQVAVPAWALAALDAIAAAIVAAFGLSRTALILLGVFVALIVVGVLAAQYSRSDPLRLTAAELRAYTDACRWESAQVWSGPASSSQERALVVVAAGTVARIAGTVAWRAGGHHIRVDLATELAQIDEQAHRIVTARQNGSPDAEAAWTALVTRVAALWALADALTATDARHGAAARATIDPAREGELTSGAARDELAADQLTELVTYLQAPAPRGLTLE